MTNIRSIDIRATLAALENAGICPSKFGYDASKSPKARRIALLAICRETWVSVCTY